MADTAVVKQEQKTELATPERTWSGPCFTPRVDIVETDEELLLYADMPGVGPDDIEVQFEKGELSVHGRCAPRGAGSNVLLSEYGVGDYFRAFSIGEAIDASRVEAKLKHGVLTLCLPKSERAKPKRICVKGD